MSNADESAKLPRPAAGEPSALQRAITALEKMKARLDAVERAASEPIAIVGAGCRFPGGGNGPEAFWRLLEEGVDAVREIPPDRWPPDAISGNHPEARWAALLDDLRGFDAAFFGISPREAETLDPQQRMLLEVTWEALEDAGQRQDLLAGGKVGVFVGLCGNDYQQIVGDALLGRYDAYCATGNLFSTAAGRISFAFGFQGPALSIDTACSSSLVAVAQACQSLRERDSDLVVAGGVNAILSPRIMAMAVETRALSSDGRCKTFDARANGFVRGEGCGVVVLKRLSDALRDGDRIRGLLRGFCVNQDGRSTGLTTPNVLAQQAMLRQAIARARVSPSDIGYVEMHGTGTSLGDPIEAEALREVLGAPRSDGSTCVLGAVKTNIGHLEGAAGMAGLLKVLLSLEHGRIPKNLHFRRLNPRIVLDGTPFVVPTEAVPWPRRDKPRFAGVSSFGISGTNAHVIVEEAPVEKANAARAASSHLLPLSAKSAPALRALCRSYAEWLSAANDVPLHDLSYTASVRRVHHEHRLSAAFGTREELATLLSSYGKGEQASGALHAHGPVKDRLKVVFVFPGQGSQWLGMGRRLLVEEPAFRAAIEACNEAIEREAGFSVLAELGADEVASRLAEIDVVQPVLFAIEVALAALWRSWGVEPDCVVGHSMGEVAAAHVAGMLGLEDAVRVICRRSRLLRRISGKGAMALVELPMTEAARALAGYEDRLDVAVSNGPRATVLSGDPGALEEVLAALEKQGVFCRRVKVDVASHSPQVDPLRDELLAALRDVRPSPGKVAMRSTVTGRALRGDELVASYWADNLRQPVRFSQVTQELLKEGHGLFVEVSPHPILLPSVEENLKEAKSAGVAIPSMRRQADERRSMLDALGALYTHGYEVAWDKLYPEGGRVVSLPAYPWQRERYWVEGVTYARPTVEATKEPLDEQVYEVQWKLAPRAGSAGRPRSAGGAWLVFGDRGGVGAELAARLRARGDGCVFVEAGSEYARTADDAYRLCPFHRDAYGRLLEDAFGPGEPCRGVIHLWSLDTTPWDETTAETVTTDQRISSISALYLSQALLRKNFRERPRLHLVTRGAQAAGNARAHVSPAQAPLWGLGRTLSLELPELECVRIDLDPVDTSAGAPALLAEIDATDGEDQVALRKDGRYVARFVRSRFDAAPARAFQIRPDATYLVTGGLGGLGLAVAAWVVEQGARHVVLVGRRAPTGAAQEQIASMQAAGAKVLVLSGDVARMDHVDAIWAELDQKMPPLAGIFHAAGVVGELIPTMHAEEKAFQEVLAPKVAGTWNLHAKTKDRPLDFFVAYSSISAVLGLSLAAAYAAANAFLDAMAQRVFGAGTAMISIQWGTIGDVGMAARHAALGGAANPFSREIAPRVAHAALSRLLARPRPCVAMVDFSVDRFLQYFREQEKLAFWSELTSRRAGGASAQVSSIRETLEAAPLMERGRLLEEYVIGQVGKVLRLDSARIDPSATFSSLGMDSLMGVELRNRLEPELDLKLSATLIFSYSSPAALAEYLLERISGPGDDAPRNEPSPEPHPEAEPVAAALFAEDDVEARLAAKLASLDKLLD
ncbi:type I polyketide synthase [Polyangium jinanense]|uniref:Type I polyketide synthase n=1 Tax=Polyangium jinanense TaxID=2829994 RepID=A0A9X3X263_9BACT|nr:type I polyketide synthase [Polyangium jinanense]MDC3954535.1 type I polyketide synthase [Polyangium jinanense]MDC3980838.1 type I polyketide synthase [Polyangium jinanense]